MDVPADATGVVGECTGAGALRLPGSPSLAVPVDILPDYAGWGNIAKIKIHFVPIDNLA